MYRKGEQIVNFDRQNFVLSHGALGDVITSLPAIIAVRQFYLDGLAMHVWTPPHLMDLVRVLLAPYGKFTIENFDKFPMKAAERKEANIGPVSWNHMQFNTHTRNRVHLVDYAFNCLTDSKPETMADRNYPTQAPIGPRSANCPLGPYVVFPVGATSNNKLFRATVMAPILKWVLANGYAAVIVGTDKSFVKAQDSEGIQPVILRDETEYLSDDLLAQCCDVRNKTTLLQLRDICGHAVAVVGVDGGTLHLAGTTDTNIIYALTTTVPSHRVIVRHGSPEYKIRYVVPRDLECAGCQSNWRMSYQDFRFCAYGDNACTEKLDSQDFITGLKELGL